MQLLDTNFKHILELNCGSGQLTCLLKTQYPISQILAVDAADKLLNYLIHQNKIIADYENLLFLENSFDLIIFNCGLQWINDIPKFLSQIFKLLKSNGIFIANFIGGNSFRKLRSKLIEVEAVTTNTHSPHISPFIRFEDVSSLLQTANFAASCSSYETIQISYANIMNLMRDLQHHGWNNCLAKANYYSITKAMYKLLNNDAQKFDEKVDLISFVAAKNKQALKLASKDSL